PRTCASRARPSTRTCTGSTASWGCAIGPSWCGWRSASAWCTPSGAASPPYAATASRRRPPTGPARLAPDGAPPGAGRYLVERRRRPVAPVGQVARLRRERADGLGGASALLEEALDGVLERRLPLRTHRAVRSALHVRVVADGVARPQRLVDLGAGQ